MANPTHQQAAPPETSDAQPKDADALRLAIKHWLIAFFVAAVIYTITADKGPQWQDSGWHQTRIMSFDINHPFGLALTHPVHFYLGRLFLAVLPLEPGFAITMLSVVAAAVTIANLFTLITLLGARRPAAAVASLGLLLAHTFFEHATHTESYALVAAFLTTEWLLLYRFQKHRQLSTLSALFFVNGTAIANHNLAMLATPTYAVIAALAMRHWWTRGDKQAAMRTAAAIPLAWIVGLAPLLKLMFTHWHANGDFAATIRSAAVGDFADAVLNTGLSPKGLALAAGFCAYNFPNLLLPLLPVGIPAAWRNPNRLVVRVLFIQFGLYALFVARYAIVDQYSYFFVLYIFFALFMGLGLDALLQRLTQTRQRIALALVTLSVAATPLTYIAAARILEDRGAFAGMVGNKPYRNGHTAFFTPWGIGKQYAEQLNDAVVAACDTDDLVLFEETMSRFGVQYAQLTGRLNPSVTIRVIGNDALDDDTRILIAETLGAGRNVVLIPRDRDKPRELGSYRLERVGDIFRVLPGRTSNSD